jgi:hypothetical protein
MRLLSYLELMELSLAKHMRSLKQPSEFGVLESTAFHDLAHCGISRIVWTKYQQRALLSSALRCVDPDVAPFTSAFAVFRGAKMSDTAT